jgi:hypothetical protein
MGVWMNMKIHESANPPTHRFEERLSIVIRKGKIEGRKEKGNLGKYRRGKRSGKKKFGK